MDIRNRPKSSRSRNCTCSRWTEMLLSNPRTRVVPSVEPVSRVTSSLKVQSEIQSHKMGNWGKKSSAMSCAGRAGLLLTVRKSRLAPTKVDWHLSRLASAEVVQCPWESPFPRLGSPHLRLLGLSDQPAIHWSSGRGSRVEYLWRIRPARSCKTNGGRRNLKERQWMVDRRLGSRDKPSRPRKYLLHCHGARSQ